jgi:hypothetical protein
MQLLIHRYAANAASENVSWDANFNSIHITGIIENLQQCVIGCWLVHTAVDSHQL